MSQVDEKQITRWLRQKNISSENLFLDLQLVTWDRCAGIAFSLSDWRSWLCRRALTFRIQHSFPWLGKKRFARDNLPFDVINLSKSNYCTQIRTICLKKRNTDIDHIKCFHWEVDKDTHTVYRGWSQQLSCVWETELQAFLYKFLYILSMLFSKMGRWDFPL